MDPALFGELSVSLTDLQDELLQFERVQEQGTTPRARESMQLLLRRAHSLKGTLRLAELSHSANLIHLVESLLVRHHHSETKVPKNGIDLVFDALDAIAAGLETTREDVSRLRSTASQLTAMLHVSVPVEPNQRAFPFPPTVEEYERILAARRSGFRLYVVDKAISTGLSRDSFDRLPIREDLASVGEVIAMRPEYGDWDGGRTEAILTFVVATRLTQNDIEAIIFDEGAFCRFPPAPAPAAASPRVSPATSPQPSELLAPGRATEESSRRFLIVEDDPTCQLLLRELLKDYGRCDSVPNGAEAVARIAESLFERRQYQLVCLDIMMPGMDGHAVLRELRRLEVAHGVAPSRRAKVLMTTALSGYDHFHQSFVEECDSYLVKPITKRILDRQLVRLGLPTL